MGLLDRFKGKKKPPSQDQFAKLLMASLKSAGCPDEVQYDKDQFQLVFSGKGEAAGLASLRNMYDEFCQIPREGRDEFLHHITRALLSHHRELPEEYEDARPDLRPTVRTRSYFELIRVQSQAEGKDFPEVPYLEIGDHLAAGLVFDFRESMRTISQGELEEWGVTFYEAMEAARENLAEAQVAFACIDDRVFASATGDNYDASRLLLLDLVRELKVQGDPVALVPNRDTLLITGSDDEKGLDIIAELADQALERPRPMNAFPLRLRGDEWLNWRVPEDHPVARKFLRLELRSLAGEYAEQKAVLEKMYEKQGIDRFIANYSVAEKDGEELFSYCVWSETIESLLPRTGRVFFFSESQEIVAGSTWERVEAIVGNLLKPIEGYPLRYLVREFPSPEQLAAIGKEGP